MEHLNEYLDFIRTVEGIKSVTRTAWTKTGRQESTAEHSFRLALLALTLIDEFPELDAKKVLSMCLIHDLGELTLCRRYSCNFQYGSPCKIQTGIP